jgi:thiol-disulfide isomerase/thioredoxin
MEKATEPMHHFFVAMLGIIVLGVLPAGQNAEAITQTAPETVELAKVTLTRGEGRTMLFSDVAPAGPVIVHFWATWCAPCRDELPAVDRFAKALAEKDIADYLVVISVDRSGYSRVAAFVEELEVDTLHSWQDASRVSGPTFRLFGFPATILLDADHRVVGRHPGPLDWDNPDTRAELLHHLELLTEAGSPTP